MSPDVFSPSLGIREDGFGNPIGKAVPDWAGCQRLPDVVLAGRTCRVVPYAVEFSEGLLAAYAKGDGGLFSYLTWGPFGSAGEIDAMVRDYMDHRGFQTFVIVTADGPVGLASFMRYDEGSGSVEIGGLTFSPLLQRTTAATEAMYLMMRHAFEGGYRRYEWKCDQLNAPSKRAAERLGFVFEGVFRNAVVTKGRRRDTAWYSVIVEEWPAVRERLEAWLQPENFDKSGIQKRALTTGS
ncbi:hypothetical protein ABAC460_13535 [Asticcacaulis sp. AC460]|uniref:GNAT family N-acetyltransferase n=1 Tax=Asticcacaulis sp. AC460 TaxID=1282360 RepID=UPI0003C3F518|nr:GNAT family protein [Asticcacaulis sp. AC460]ESQ89086.1 hypothetical protein ABAC460_13535 [Asticcacaulis sp. AC460]